MLRRHLVLLESPNSHSFDIVYKESIPVYFPDIALKIYFFLRSQQVCYFVNFLVLILPVAENEEFKKSHSSFHFCFDFLKLLKLILHLLCTNEWHN